MIPKIIEGLSEHNQVLYEDNQYWDALVQAAHEENRELFDEYLLALKGRLREARRCNCGKGGDDVSGD